MSRIGKKPVQIPSGVEVKIEGMVVKVKGPKGELIQKIPHGIKVEITGRPPQADTGPINKLSRSDTTEGQVVVARTSDEHKNLHGTLRTLINNMITGTTQGFEKRLDVQGVGFRAQTKGKDLELNIGFSHPVNVKTPANLTVEIDKDKKNIIIIRGIDKQAVGEFAAILRSMKKPEPYKGKGIRYEGEIVKQKAGKAVAGAAGGAAGGGAGAK